MTTTLPDAPEPGAGPTSDPAPVAARGHNLWTRLYHDETRYDFVGRRRIGFIISAVLVVVGLVSLGTQRLNLGIDFEGGVAWEVPAAGIDTDDVRSVIESNGLTADRLQTLRGTEGERIRVQVDPQPLQVQNDVRADLATLAQVDPQEVSLNAVGPSWGDEISEKAVRALIAFLVLVSLYLSIRLEWKMAVGAIAAVGHDVLITVGIYSLFQFEVTPSTVVAFLTILGFSLYDTIVVFDKIHENTKRFAPTGKMTYGDITNISMNQVLMRSLNTSLAAVLPVLSLLIVGSVIMGAVALQDFALALLVGLLAGSYSSIFVATPILWMLKAREPRYRQLSTRLGGEVTSASTSSYALTPQVSLGAGASSRSSGTALTTGAAGTTTGSTAGSTTGAAPPAAGVIPPRPRKKKRR